MKATILTLATLLSCSLIMVNAQTPTFQKGNKVLNLGIGFGGYSPSGYQIKTPSLAASFEIGVKDKVMDNGSFGVGGYLGYAGYDQSGSFTGNTYWSVSRILIGVRGVFHYPLVEKLDTYGGLTLGFMTRSWKWNGSVERTDHPNRKPFSGDIFVGSRYYFSDKFAALGELSLGTYLSLGISMKL